MVKRLKLGLVAGVATLIVGTLAFVIFLFFSFNDWFSRDLETFDPAKAKRERLRVLTYPFFASVDGPGPQIIKTFELLCQCDVELTSAPHSSFLFLRAQLEEKRGRGFDVVVGLTSYELARAKEAVRWSRLAKIETPLKFDIEFEQFVPFNWSTLVFLARNHVGSASVTLEELASTSWRGRLAISDPRTSVPGYVFLHWIIKTLGEEEGWSYLDRLLANDIMLPPTWSVASELFQKNEAAAMWSFHSSLVFYQNELATVGALPLLLIDERGEDIPMPTYVEYAGIPSRCVNCGLGQRFLRFLVTERGQRILMNHNYMDSTWRDRPTGTDFDVLVPPLWINWSPEETSHSLRRQWAEFRSSRR